MVTGAPVGGVQQWDAAKLTGLKKCLADFELAGKMLLINLELKGFKGGHIAPTYARTGFGNTKYGTGCEYPYEGPGTSSGGFVLAVHLPLVQAEYNAWSKALITELENHRPNSCEGMFFTETAVGTGKPPLTTAETDAQFDGWYDMMIVMRNHAKKFWIGMAVNYPKGHTRAMDGLSDKMIAAGLAFFPPDIWPNSDEWEYLPAEPTTYAQKKVANFFPDAWNATAAAPRKMVLGCQIQAGDYENDNHTDGNAADKDYKATGNYNSALWKLVDQDRLFEKARRFGWFAGYRQCLGLTHLAVATKNIKEGRHTDPGEQDPWSIFKPILAAKYALYGIGCGMSMLRPDRIDLGLTGTDPVPTAPTISLNTDTGIVQVAPDLPVTSSGAVTVGSVTAPNNWQISVNNGTTWGANNVAPTPVAGTNTWVARQVTLSGVPSLKSVALAFIYDIIAPTVTSTVVIDDQVTMICSEIIADVAPYIPGIARFTFTNAGVNNPILNKSVDGTARTVQLGLTNAVLAGQTCLLSHNQTAGTNEVQDLAGNKLATFTNAAVTNSTGAVAPTQTVAVVSATDNVGTITGTLSSGASTNDNLPLISGTVSAVLTGSQVLDLFMDTPVIGQGTMVGTAWSFQVVTPAADGLRTFKARVRNGALLGPISPTFTLNVITALPATPVVADIETEDTTPILNGTWVNVAGSVLTVTIAAETHTSSSGVTVSGNTWTMQVITPLTPDIAYDVTATVTDSVGNVSADGNGVANIVLPSSAGGVVIDAVATLIAGSASIGSIAPSRTYTATASLIAGSVTASASPPGVTLTAVSSMIRGLTSINGNAIAQGKLLIRSFQMLLGSASGGSGTSVGGVTLTVDASMIEGATPTGTATAGGAVLSCGASIAIGAVAANSAAAGTIYVRSPTWQVVKASADSQAAAQTLAAAALLVSGSASGSSGANAVGVVLARAVSMLSGSVVASNSAAGVTLTAAPTLVAGAPAAGAVKAGFVGAVTASLISGLPSASQTAPADTVQASAALLAGGAAGGASATSPGALLTAGAALVAGTAGGGGSGAGATLTASASLLAGTVGAGGSVPSVNLSASAALIAGGQASASTAPAAIVQVSALMQPGTASGTAGASVSGILISVGSGFVPAMPASSSAAAAATVSATAALLAGAASASVAPSGQRTIGRMRAKY
jgi:hypothetical protein